MKSILEVKQCPLALFETLGTSSDSNLQTDMPLVSIVEAELLHWKDSEDSQVASLAFQDFHLPLVASRRSLGMQQVETASLEFGEVYFDLP